MAKIDIIIPYWGDFNLFKLSVNSVIGQTSTNWRLTILDDCYPSREAKKYIEQLKNPKISYIRHKKNIGVTENFNFAAKIAKEKYTVILGYDDMLLPNYVKRALSQIGDADFYHPKVQVVNYLGNKTFTLTDFAKGLIRPKSSGMYCGEKLAISLCRGNWLYFPSITWKTSTLKKYNFNNKYKTVQDVDFEMNVITNGGKLYLDNEPTFKYRRFAGSLSSKEKSSDGTRFEEEKAIYLNLSKDLSNIGWDTASRVAKNHYLSKIHKMIS